MWSQQGRTICSSASDAKFHWACARYDCIFFSCIQSSRHHQKIAQRIVGQRQRTVLCYRSNCKCVPVAAAWTNREAQLKNRRCSTWGAYFPYLHWPTASRCKIRPGSFGFCSFVICSILCSQGIICSFVICSILCSQGIMQPVCFPAECLLIIEYDLPFHSRNQQRQIITS